MSTDNPDPEGQGFCQAGFSLDFYKVRINSFWLGPGSTNFFHLRTERHMSHLQLIISVWFLFLLLKNISYTVLSIWNLLITFKILKNESFPYFLD